MARNLCLIDDPASLFLGSAGSAEFVVLPPPRGGPPRSYLLAGGRLLELTRVGSPASAPSSWFLDQHVKSDGSALVATEVDPVFLLLPLLEANGGRFSPLHQYLSAAPGGDCGALRRVARLRGALERTCELRNGTRMLRFAYAVYVRDRCARDDMLL